MQWSTFFPSVVSSDPLTTVRRRLLMFVSAFLFLLGVVFAILALLEQNYPQLSIQVGLNIFYAGTYVLARYGYVRTAGLLVTLVLFLLFFAAPPPQEILSGAFGSAFLVPILVFGIVYGWRGILAAMLVTLAGFPLISLLRDVPMTPTTAMLAIMTIWICALLAIMVSSLERSTLEAYQQAESARAAEREIAQREQTLVERNSALQQAMEDQQRLISTIQELETPILTLRQGLLVVPIIGYVDTRRAEEITQRVLEAVHQQRAVGLILDISGVSVLDTMVIQRLQQLVQSVRLLGTQVLISGIKASFAHTIVELGIDMRQILTAGHLEDGIAQIGRLWGMVQHN